MGAYRSKMYRAAPTPKLASSQSMLGSSLAQRIWTTRYQIHMAVNRASVRHQVQRAWVERLAQRVSSHEPTSRLTSAPTTATRKPISARALTEKYAAR